MPILKRLDFLIPGDLDAPTGGYIYDRRIADGLRSLDWEVVVHRLDASFPVPSAAALDRARALLTRIPCGSLVLIDGLAMGAMPTVVSAQAGRLTLVALVHHPLAMETGLSDNAEGALRRAEELALAAADLVIVTSRYTARLVARLGVPAPRIEVVEPGTEPRPLARGSSRSTLNLLCVAAVTHRKGHAVLVDALAEIKDHAWRLNCAGSLDRDPDTVAALREQIARLGLAGRVSLAGEVDPEELQLLFHRADLFVLSTRFEGYGMALAEAIAHGLPIVSTRAGAVPDTVPKQTALLVPPDDPVALAEALTRTMDDPLLLRRLARGARASRALLPTWQDASRRMDEALRAVLR